MINRYRPTDFSEVRGNLGVIKSLKTLLKDKRFPHSILLKGEPGCGKTTLARIIASKLTNQRFSIYEINCGATGGKDQTLKLIEKFKYSPLDGGNQIFILDEAQGLTKDSQRSLLIPIENAQSYNYFIFCSTEPNKIDKALKSRLTEYSLSPLNTAEMIEFLSEIWDKEKYEHPNKEKILQAIAKHANGIPRDALTILQKLKGITDIDEMRNVMKNYVLEENEAFELPRLLVKSPKWEELVELYKKLSEKFEDDSLRISTAKYFKAIFLKAPSEKTARILSILSEEIDGALSDVKFLLQLYKIIIKKKDNEKEN